MRQIKKGNEPATLTAHRLRVNASYDNYAHKDDVRVSTHLEQRGLCCYCMAFIQSNEAYMKIEHYQSQNVHPQYQLKYWNLLGACLGNQGQPGKDQHCDTFKGNKKLNYYPADKLRKIEDMIWYSNDGTIGSNHSGLDDEMNSILNLNVLKLKTNRKATLQGFTEGLSRYKGKLDRDSIKRWIETWGGLSHTNMLNPYCQIVVFWLKKKLKQ